MDKGLLYLNNRRGHNRDNKKLYRKTRTKIILAEGRPIHLPLNSKATQWNYRRRILGQNVKNKEECKTFKVHAELDVNYIATEVKNETTTATEG
jgi:hypothetical protein